VVLSAAEREQLAAIAADRPRKHVERARIVRASADRHSAQQVAQSVGISRPTVWRCQQRFAESGVEGLLRGKPGKAPLAARAPVQGMASVAVAWQTARGRAMTEEPRRFPHGGVGLADELVRQGCGWEGIAGTCGTAGGYWHWGAHYLNW
jgi:hypothetical protein